MAKGHRQERLGEEIKKIISNLILRELKDPRFQSAMVSISAVDVTSDGSYATAYVSVLGLNGQTEEHDGILAALKNAKGFIRREIGKQVKIRHVPDLMFRLDTSQEYGQHIDQIIQDLSVK